MFILQLHLLIAHSSATKCICFMISVNLMQLNLLIAQYSGSVCICFKACVNIILTDRSMK